MLFEDQIEQGKEYFDSLYARVQENSLFISMSDRFKSLSPNFQKILIACAGTLVLFVILIKPLANYSESVENMSAFEERKTLTQKIIDYRQKAKSSLPNPKKYTTNSLSQEVTKLSGSRTINFLPTQTSVAADQVSKKIVSAAEQSDFTVKTTKANVQQVTALAYSLQKSNSSLLLTAIDFKSNSENPAYFDSSIRFANLYVKPASEILPKPEPEKKKKRNSRRRGRN